MGGEPWLIRKPFENNVEQVINKHQKEILEKTPDWPEIRLSQTAKLRDEDGDGWPEPGSICCLAAFDEGELIKMFGTAKPQISIKAEDVWAKVNWGVIPRGEGHYLLLYNDGNPAEVCFLGYSLD